MTMSSTPQKNTEPPGQACCVCKKKSACGHPGRNEDRRWTPRGLCLASFSSLGQQLYITLVQPAPSPAAAWDARQALRSPSAQGAEALSPYRMLLSSAPAQLCSMAGEWRCAVTRGGVVWGGSGGHLRFSLGCAVWNRVSGRSLHDGGFESVLFLRDSSSCEFDGGVSGTVLNIC